MNVANRVVFNRGAGLGNRLFPWARCVIASAESGTPMLAPHWWWPPRRTGMLLGIFQPRPSEVSGIRRLLLEATPTRLANFHGDGEQFAVLGGRRRELLAAFREATRPRWVRMADATGGAVIGLHVRRGDFNVATSAADFTSKGALRTPADWFRAMLRAARSIAGSDVPAIITSDGSAADLADLLAEPNVRLLRSGSPATDLLVLANTRLLIGSGGSSFSAWAAYFGGIPVFTIPGQSLMWFKAEHGGNVVGVCDPSAPSQEFDDACRALTP